MILSKSCCVYFSFILLDNFSFSVKNKIWLLVGRGRGGGIEHNKVFKYLLI